MARESKEFLLLAHLDGDDEVEWIIFSAIECEPGDLSGLKANGMENRIREQSSNPSWDSVR